MKKKKKKKKKKKDAYVQQGLKLTLSNSGTKTLGNILPFKCYSTL